VKNGITLFLLRKVVNAYHLPTKTRGKVPHFAETPIFCESIAEISLGFLFQETSQRKAE